MTPKGPEEDTSSVHDESHVSNRYMTWWRNVWWIRVHMRSARGWRKTWRAARQAAEQVADEVGSERPEGETEGETDGDGKKSREKDSKGSSSSSSASPSRSCASLRVRRLALRCTMSTSLQFRRHPQYISSSSNEMSPLVCGFSRVFPLT